MENSPTYRVVFSGRLLDGFDPAEVKRGLASQLSRSPEKIEAFFSGEKQVLKRADSLERASWPATPTSATCWNSAACWPMRRKRPSPP